MTTPLIGQPSIDNAIAELDRRLREMENRSISLSAANRFSSQEATRVLVGRDAPTAVSGLQITPGVSGTTTFDLSWSPARISNLRFYDVQFSASADMAEPTALQTSQTRVALEIGYGATRYARVRAQSLNGAIGDWSVVIDTTTGLINYPSIEGGAATNFVKTIDDRSYLPGGGYTMTVTTVVEMAEYFGYTQFETIGELVWPTSIIKIKGWTTNATSHEIIVDALIDNQIYATTDAILVGTTFSSAAMCISGFVSPFVPPAGNHVFSTRIAVRNPLITGSHILTVRSVETSLYEFRR